MAQQYFAFFSIIFGCPANFLLIWLILFRTTKSARVWSWILLQTALLDLANLFMFVIVQPMLISGDLNLFLYSEGPFGQFNYLTIFYLFHCCFLLGYLSKYIIAGQFFYRWLIICRDRTMTPRLYALIIGIPILTAVMLVTFCTYNSGPKESGICPKCPPNLTHIFMNPKGSSRLNPILTMSSELVSYSIILATSISIWRKSRSSIIPQQKHSREFSRQIGLVLLVQAILPLIFSLIPSFLIAVFLAAKSDFPDWISLISLEPWPSQIFPVVTILIIGRYRRCVTKLIVCRKETTPTTSVNTIQIRVKNNGVNNNTIGIIRSTTY